MNLEYAETAEGTHVAYQVMSPGAERTLVYVHGALYPIDVMEDDPPYARFLHGLGALGQLIAVEKQGVGASDPVDFSGDVYRQWAGGVVAVLDDLGVERADMVGYGIGAAVGLEVAASHPERVSTVVCIQPVVQLPEARHLLDAAISDLSAVIARSDGATEGVLERNLPSRVHDPAYREWNRRAGQLGASPATAAKFWAAALGPTSDLWTRLGDIEVPVAILHRTESRLVALEWSQRLAEVTPNSRLITMPGADSGPNAGDVDGLLAEIAAFLTGDHRIPGTQRPVLSILFTDIVDSTTQLTEGGDARWTAALDQHDHIVRRALGRHGGTLVKTTGDGALATFDSPTRALAGGVELRDALHEEGLEVRMGVHVGEVDRRGDDVAGVAIHLAARLMDHATAGEIVTSAAVPLVAAGGSLEFDELGRHELRGLEGDWELYRLRS